ncbi:hypothetical protein [Actinophytocola sediminis]
MNISTATEHPLDAVVPDPAGLPPLCDEALFAESLAGMVADEAPRLFAVVQEYGERVDSRIAAWGLAFDDRVEIVDVDDGSRLRLRTSDRALRTYTWGSHIHARLVWVDPNAATWTDDGVD